MHEITLNPPFPTGEERSASAGRGDRGQGSKLKAGQAGDKESTPPPGTAAARSASDQPGKPPRHLSGRVSCPPKKAPHPTFLLSPLASGARM